ncbi:hypothetical protein [Limosilactobacillus sp.]|jgi:hypothetical protein|uniref:hypothetical protein n=1 Tax=Limosilactobacillus sp. TaxID=2773925 RepID=UPI0035A0D193
MNQEIKQMLKIAGELLIAILVITNLEYWITRTPSVKGTDAASQLIAENRLRKPNIKHPSELGNYPSIKKKVVLVMDSQANKLYVINGHRIVYIMHANCDLSAGHYHLQKSQGQSLYHVDNGKHSYSANWQLLSNKDIIESPQTINGQKVAHNWIKPANKLQNTIQLSQPDAKWLQQLPKGIELNVK